MMQVWPVEMLAGWTWLSYVSIATWIFVIISWILIRFVPASFLCSFDHVLLSLSIGSFYFCLLAFLAFSISEHRGQCRLSWYWYSSSQWLPSLATSSCIVWRHHSANSWLVCGNGNGSIKHSSRLHAYLWKHEMSEGNLWSCTHLPTMSYWVSTLHRYWYQSFPLATCVAGPVVHFDCLASFLCFSFAGYPIPKAKRVQCKHCKKFANKDDWNKFVSKARTCSWCGTMQNSIFWFICCMDSSGSLSCGCYCSSFLRALPQNRVHFISLRFRHSQIEACLSCVCFEDIVHGRLMHWKANEEHSEGKFLVFPSKEGSMNRESTTRGRRRIQRENARGRRTSYVIKLFRAQGGRRQEHQR